jgi:transcriptional regulator with XRE-family HTH domain
MSFAHDDRPANADSTALPADSVAMRELGSRLAALRTERRMSISALAALAEVSTGFISQLERGLGNPTFLTVMKLSSALGVPFASFFSGDESGSRPAVIHQEDRRRLAVAENLEYELLSPTLHGKLGVFIVRMPPGWTQAAPLQHEGEELNLILEGRGVFHINGVDYEMKAGDSITFDAMEPHWGHNPYDETVVSLACMTPPSI